MVEGRSSFARVGIAVHMTAPKIDPGFDNHIALEMHNVGKDRVTLRAGEDMPAQLICFELSTPTGCLMNGGRLRGLCTCHRGVVVVWPPGVARQVKGANAS